MEDLIKTNGLSILVMIIGSSIIGLIVTSGLASISQERQESSVDNLTLISIILTIVVYLGTRWLSERIVSPITTPVLTATIVLIIIFQTFDITVEQYAEAKVWMTFLLGPATVALAVPMYHNRSVIMDRLFPALFGIIIGSIQRLFRLFGFPNYFAFQMSSKQHLRLRL